MKLAPNAICLVVAGVLAGLPAIASAQLLVAPRRPGQTNVRYAEFDWRFVDILTHEKLELDVEWDRGPRLHQTPFEPPAQGSWAWPSLKDAPLGPTVVGDPVTLESEDDDKTPPGKRRRPCTTRKNPRPGERVCPVTEILETAGGVRLYFYESERTLAERAAASIESSYRYLAEQFGYAPRKTFAYFLYGNYIEFLQTELFPIQEGVLGVTSTMSLELTLPYFGDHRMFEDVSTHELAHEFMLQKLLTVAKADGNDGDAALGAIPLWFVEGLAEYYAKRGLDPEAEVLVRDMVVNPTEEGYAMGSFFDERLTSGLWTYKVGQARCAFLEEVYGAGTLQRILEESPRLMRSQDRGGVSSFRKLVAQVTGEASSRIAARFERWIKRRAYASYLATSQDRTDMGVIFEVSDIVQTMSASPSGSILMYRSIDPDTGAGSLYLADRHEPEDTVRVAMDGTPGVESLHPVAGRNFDLNDDILAFVAQSEGADVIYVQHFEHESEPLPCSETGPRASTICEWDVDFELGDRHALVVADLKIAAVEAVALAPDGNRVAFIGLDASGQKDVWVSGDLRSNGGALIRITNDVYGERDVAWGPRGVVYSSDATGHGKYNLFLADPTGKTATQRLTQEARDEMDPEMLPDGRILFIAYDHAGANLYEAKGNGVIVRHTDVTTGLYDPSPGPDGSVWALHHQSHRRLPVRLVGSALRGQPVAQSAPDTPAVPLPRMSLLVDREYNPLALENWRPGAIFVLAGFSGDAVFGSLIATASDRLQDHALVLTTSVFGSFDRTDADLTYINQENRVVWGAGVFHDVSAQYDDTFLLDEDLLFVSYQRFFGGTGIVRYPFDRFFFAQAGFAAGGAEYFVSENTERALRDPEQNDTGRDLLTPWEEKNDGLRFRTETTFSLGYSTLGLHRATGPIRGSALILSHTIGNEPFDDLAYHQTRLDAEHYIRIIGATNLLMRGAAGTTTGDRRAPQYFLSSFHTLRGVPFGDTDFLLGREFFYSTLELQFPIATLSDFPLVDLEGVLGADFGGVGDGMHDLWRRRVLDLVFGVNLGFAPIVIRLHFAQPIGIGAPLPNNGDLTFNFSLAWRY